MNAHYQGYLRTLPQAVRYFAAQYPMRPGERIEFNGTDRWFIGYGQDKDGSVDLIVSTVNPRLDYTGAIEAREYLSMDNHYLDLRM